MFGDGVDTVTLTVTGACGSDAEVKTGYITVDGPPVAGFYGTPTSGEAPLTVDFYDQSTGNVTSWDWDFGDGGSNTGAGHGSMQIHNHDAAADETIIAYNRWGSSGSSNSGCPMNRAGTRRLLNHDSSNGRLQRT